MKRIIVDDTVIYNQPGVYGYEMGSARKDEVLDLGKIIRDDGKKWIEVLSGIKVTGYINGESLLIDPEKYCFVNQEFVDMYETPDTTALILKRYSRMDEIYLVDRVSDGKKMWYKLFDYQGNSGFITADTVLKSSEVSGQTMVLRDQTVKVYKEADEFSEVVSGLACWSKVVLIKLIKDAYRNKWYKIVS